MSYNSSNFTITYDDIIRDRILTSIGIINGIFTAWIILANVFITITILSSATLRCKLRNQLIVNICFVDFLVGIVFCPVVSQSLIERTWSHSCHFTNVLILFSTYSDIFMVMWLLVTQDVLYLTKQLRLELPPLSNLSGILLKIFCNGLPWILLFVVQIPIVMSGYGDENSISTICTMVFDNKNDIHASVIGFFIPAAIIIVLIVCFVVFHTCAKPQVRNAEESLLDEPVALEHPIFYIIPSLVVTLLGSLDQSLRIIVASSTTIIFDRTLLFKLIATSTILEVARCGVLPLSWLLLPDIRSAIKNIWSFVRTTRSSETEHQTMSYKKDVESA